MTAGWQNKYSIGSSNSDGYEEETHGTERVGIQVYIHTLETLNSLRSFSSRQQTQMRAALGRAGRQAGRQAGLHSSLSLHTQTQHP